MFYVRQFTPVEEAKPHDTIVGNHAHRREFASHNTGVWVARKDDVWLNGKSVPVDGVYVELRWQGNSIWVVLPDAAAVEFANAILNAAS